jgi:hypothetical protein
MNPGAYDYLTFGQAHRLSERELISTSETGVILPITKEEFA